MLAKMFKAAPSTKGTGDADAKPVLPFRELSVFWRIENFSLLAYHAFLDSAPFGLRCVSDGKNAQKFRIIYHINASNHPNGTVVLHQMYCNMSRSKEKRLPHMRVSFSAVLASGEHLKFHDGGLLRNGIEVEECEDQFEDYNFLTLNRSSHLPNDSLTILVHFASKDPIFEVDRLFARTLIPHKKFVLEWEIEDLLVENCRINDPDLPFDLELRNDPDSDEDAYEVAVSPRNMDAIPTVCDVLLMKESGERIVIKDFAVIRAECKRFPISKSFCERHAEEALENRGGLKLYFQFRTRDEAPVSLDFDVAPPVGWVVRDETLSPPNAPNGLPNDPKNRAIRCPERGADRNADLIADLQNLYTQHAYSDFTLKAGGKSFPVHRVLLSARSAFFRDMFEKQESVCEVKDVDKETMDRVLRFVYSNEFRDLDLDVLTRLSAAADKFRIGSLQSRCLDSLESGLTAENVCRVLAHADAKRYETLAAAARRFVLWNSDLVFQTEQWKLFQADHKQLAGDIMLESLSDRQP